MCILAKPPAAKITPALGRPGRIATRLTNQNLDIKTHPQGGILRIKNMNENRFVSAHFECARAENKLKLSKLSLKNPKKRDMKNRQTKTTRHGRNHPVCAGSLEARLNEDLREVARLCALSSIQGLLAQGADPSSLDEFSQTALICASSSLKDDAFALPCMRLLLSKSDARASDLDGDTSLVLAAELGRPARVALLLPWSDAKAKNRKGINALMRSAQQGDMQSVRLLLPQSDILAEDRNGSTASVLARRLANGEVALVLEHAENAERACRERLEIDPSAHRDPKPKSGLGRPRM